MNKLTIDTAEALALQLRSKLGLGTHEPINAKTLIRQLHYMLHYRPLSESLLGMSLKSPDSLYKFILINSNTTRGRQHFTIAHEIYHLEFEEDIYPHYNRIDREVNVSERNADMFACALLMPRQGIISKIPASELASKNISIETCLTLGQLYGVSHSTLVFRLKELKLITQENEQKLMQIKVKQEAYYRGFDLSLYNSGNNNVMISDYGLEARQLYNEEKISEGHYLELLRLIYDGKCEDNIRC